MPAPGGESFLNGLHGFPLRIQELLVQFIDLLLPLCTVGTHFITGT